MRPMDEGCDPEDKALLMIAGGDEPEPEDNADEEAEEMAREELGQLSPDEQELIRFVRRIKTG